MIQVGKTLGNIGVIYKNRGEYSKALEYYLKEKELFLEMNYSEGLIPIYPNLGNISVSMNNLQRAEEYYKLGLKLAYVNSNRRESSLMIRFSSGALTTLIQSFCSQLKVPK